MAQLSEASFERCCRLCAEEQEVTVMIFSQEAEAMLLQNKLNKYLLIEVDEDDKLPKNICIQCCTKLQTVCDFIDAARKAQEVLLNRSFMFEGVISDVCTITTVKEELISESEESYDDENKFTEMEVSVDPMMVLQNCEGPQSPNNSVSDSASPEVEDVTYLHDVDADNVTIKLIRRNDKDMESVKEKKPKPFPCVTCKRSFYSELALKNHSWVHTKESKTDDEQYKCSTCNEMFDYKCDLITHLKEHRSNGRCQLCGRMFRSEKTYIAHMSVHLPTNKSFNCKICGRSYNTWGSLRTHSVTHSAERPYECPYCKKNFKRKQDLKFHINQHTGAKPYKCPFCDKSFASSGNCYSHRSRMHPGKHVEGRVRKWNNTARENPQAKQTGPKLPVTNVKGILKFQCVHCDHTFIKKDNYIYHMYQHTGEKPFQCSFCEEEFVTRRGLMIHHEKVHPSKERPLGLISKNILLK